MCIYYFIHSVLRLAKNNFKLHCLGFLTINEHEVEEYCYSDEKTV